MTIPAFPEFRPVELADRHYIERLLELEQPTASEMCFANIFLWRETYSFRVASLDGGIVVRASHRSGDTFYLLPFGVNDLAASVRTMLSEDSNYGKLYRVPESAAKALESAGFRVQLDRDNSDYVYLSSDLIELAGRKLHRKRNHIAQFRSKYDYEYHRVTTKDLVIGCADLQTKWCDIRDCFQPENFTLAEEHRAIMEALSNLDELGLVAGAVMIDGHVAAFSIGGPLNDETLVIHFEKANPAYPGLYQVINKEYCTDVAVDYRYVNREQDLGEPGLRKAKESYYPHHMVDKYIVEL